MRKSKKAIIGRWRITDMEAWDADFIDMMEPGYIRFDADGSGEFVFGTVYGAISGTYGSGDIDFTWEGNSEMDSACGDGYAKLKDDGTLTGEIRFHAGDESSFTARRWPT